VPALDRHIPLHRDQLLLSHQFSRAVRDGLVLAARPGIGAEPDNLFEFLRRQTRDSAALEAERLLYVACTRAKWRLHLSAMVGRREDNREENDGAGGESRRRAPWKPRTGSLLAVLWPVAGAEFAPDPGNDLPDQMNTREAAGDVAPRGGPLYRLPRDWSPPAADTFPVGEQMSAITALREETPVFDWAGETARRVGSLVHSELQVMELEHSDEGGIESRGPHFRDGWGCTACRRIGCRGKRARGAAPSPSTAMTRADIEAHFAVRAVRT
jgi:ATP-dependent exoDNAse (exonuclease V) beta subunit